MMRDWFTLPRLCVYALVPILLVSFYYGVVPSVEIAYGGDILGSVALYDGESPEPSGSFEISDVVVFRLGSSWANYYSLVVSNGTRDVYVGSGGLDRSHPEIELALYPPTFHAKTAYAYSLHVSAFNYPLPGGVVSDGTVGAFLVEGAETDLALNVSYDDESHGLTMEAVLVNGESEPIANQTVGFYLQPDGNDTSLPDRGWVPLGSSVTDGAGRTALSVVYRRDGGCHKVQARFSGAGFRNATADALFTIRPQTPQIELALESFANGSKLTARLTGDDGYPLSYRLVYFQFGSSVEKPYAFTDADGLASTWLKASKSVTLSEEQVTVTVAADTFTAETSVSSGLSLIADSFSLGQSSATPHLQFEVQEDGGAAELNVSADTPDCYALVDNRLHAGYLSDVNLGMLNMSFVMDAERPLGHVYPVEPIEADGLFLYTCSLDWVPRELYELGNHTVWAYAYDHEHVLVAEGNLIVCVHRTPCNTELLFPGALVGGNYSLVTSFAVPRAYVVENPCPYVHTYRLAPRVSHGDVEYIVDDLELPTPVLVKVRVNDVPVVELPVSGRGVVVASWPVGFDSYGRTWWDVNVTVDPGVTTQGEIRKLATLTKNWITSSTSSDDEVDYSVSIGGLNETGDTHALSNLTIEASASLFGEPLAGLQTIHTAARLQVRDDWQYRLSGLEGDFARFRFFYNLTSSTARVWADINRDGKVDIFDVIKVRNEYSRAVDTSLNWTETDLCDTDGCGTVTMTDFTRVTSNYGKRLYYFGISDLSTVQARFYDVGGGLLDQSYLDIRGCVLLPNGTRSVKLFWRTSQIGAMFEEFVRVSTSEGTTDFLGRFRSGFAPSSKGVWIVQSKSPGFTAIRLRFGLYYDYGQALDGCLNMIEYFCVTRNPTNLLADYSPRNTTGPVVTTCTADLVNALSAEPVGQATVKVALWKWIQSWGGFDIQGTTTIYTNGSGIAVYSLSASQTLYKVVFTYEGNSTFLSSSRYIWIDTRRFSNLEVKIDKSGDGVPETLIGNCTAVDLGTGVSYKFSASAFPKTTGMGRILVYVDGIQTFNISDSGTFNWMPPSNNTYYLRVAYVGGESTRPCQLDFVVKAQVLPLLIHFDASATKFKPEDVVTLHAFAVVADTNQTFMGGLTFRFLQDGCSVVNVTDVPANRTAEAYCRWAYPSGDIAHTITVNVTRNGETLKYMVEPITLEVFRDTRLLFWVERDNSSKHVFHGKLVTTEGAVVPDQPIRVYLNDTEIQSGLKTDDNGCFTFERNFNPSDQKVTYTVQVSFEGTGSLSAVLNATALDGTRYAVCQTTQFNYRSSANMTQITVEPQATQVTVPTKTSEEMQQDAQGKGLEVWGPDSFTIWPPFFKLHAKAYVDWLGTAVQNWIGLFAFGVDLCEGVGKLLETGICNVPTELISIATSAIVSTIATTATLYAASMIAVQLAQLTVGGYFAALGIYTGAGALIISAARLISDVWLSKALLFGIGFSLIGLVITGFFADQFLARFFSPLLSQTIAGGDPTNTAFKYVVNFFANYVIKSALALTASVFFLNPLMWPFAIATFTLGALAIYLGKTR